MSSSNIAIIATIAMVSLIDGAWAGAVPVPVPEPASLGLLVVAGVGLVVAKLRNRK